LDGVGALHTAGDRSAEGLRRRSAPVDRVALHERIVFGCVQANSPICGKANQDKTPTKAMRDFCAGQPNAEVIPLSVIGHENPMIYDWTCNGKEPGITRQIFKVDAQGFPSELWDKIAPANK
jgi:hypothetical protein